MNDDSYLTEYINLCWNEWSKKPIHTEEDIKVKKNRILYGDKVISILGLIDHDTMIGFISLFRYDGDKEKELTPWYATMYVKEEYRGKGYSKKLNDAILEEAKQLGYQKVYLKSELLNYYEKFGAEYIKDLDDKEKLYYIDIIHSL